MQNTSENAPQVIKTGTSAPLLNMEAPHKARTPSAIRQRVVKTFLVLNLEDTIFVLVSHSCCIKSRSRRKPQRGGKITDGGYHPRSSDTDQDKSPERATDYRRGCKPPAEGAADINH